MSGSRANQRFKEDAEKERVENVNIARDTAVRYINWLNSKTIDDATSTRAGIIPRATTSTDPGRDYCFLQSLHRLAVDIKFDKMDQFIKHDGSGIILWLLCSAKTREKRLLLLFNIC